MKREPHHFSMHDFAKAVFGSFVIGLTFLFKGSMVSFAQSMHPINIAAVIILTLIIVTLEIYLLSYKFVKNRQERPFYEFWGKRFFAITIASFSTVYLMVYLYGFNYTLSNIEIFKLTSAIFLPSAIAGAAVEMLKKRV